MTLADTTVPSTTAATVEFTSPEFRFRLRHPADWIRPEQPVNGQVFLTDLGSSNGSFVRLMAETEVINGDVLLMGQQLFRVNM